MLYEGSSVDYAAQQLIHTSHSISQISFPDFPDVMIVEITLQPAGNGTKVSFLFKNIPKGINPKDNEKGTLSSLEKLARYVE